MAKADSLQNGIKTDTTDDVEKSLELLDKVLSEFEEEHEVIHAHPVEPDSPSQGNQSEDDGYMSMNGRRAKFVPDFQPTDEANAAPLPLPVPPDGKYSPPSPEEAERIISNLLPRISPTSSPTHRTNSTGGSSSSSNNIRSPVHINSSSTTASPKRINILQQQQQQHHHHHSSSSSSSTSEWRTRNLVRNNDSSTSSSEKPSSNDNTVIVKSPTQTTLPKTRPSNVLPTRYASLPCSSPPKHTEPSEPPPSGGSLDDGRNQLGVGGIGISAVHDAVLRGMTRMPEPIVNEHPVTIYPGRASPPRRVPPRNLPGSIERHGSAAVATSVCRPGNYPSDNSQSSQENSSPENNESENNSSLSPTHGVPLNINYNHGLVTNRIFATTSAVEFTRPTRPRNGKQQQRPEDSDEERFSEDSLEESSLPPPPGPVTVPPPPSLSAPVTPSKRHSIAWEVNLDDPASFGDPLTTAKPANSGCSKVIGRRKTGGSGKNVTSSQSSLESTPSNRKSESNEWPDPPDIPICSTEDEAASLYSDSDELIPNVPDISGRGTYVIRKGRRRQRLESLDSNASNHLPIPGSDQVQPPATVPCPAVVSILPSPVFPVSMLTPKSRHSIDLGISSTSSSLGATKFTHSGIPSKIPSSVLSPRSRLSLDLSSPTSELPPNVKKITSPTGSFPVHHSQMSSQTPMANTSSNSLNKSKSNHGSNNNLAGGVTAASGGQQSQQQQQPIVSSRYTEFKTYSSTFDALQALEGSASSGNGATNGNNSNNNSINRGGGAIGNGTSVVSCSDSTDGSSLMRVSSLPGVTPQHPTSTAADGLSTPRRELAPPIEEDEEADSDTQRGVPLRKIEDNISALLRGDISVARVADIPPSRRPLGFRLGVHKSESAKEMLLSQAGLGPLPPSPPLSSPEPQDSDEFPPLPPSPTEEPEVIHQMHGIRISSRTRSSSSKHDGHFRDDHPPAVPPHRGPSINTLKTRSMDAGFSKSYRNGSHASTSPHAPGTLPPDLPGCNSRRRVITGGYQKRTAQSPREERSSSLQTSCSLPETPIFARGSCDIPRTPHRRAPEVPPHGSGSRTAPRTNTNTTGSLGSSVVGIGTSTIGGRQRSISQAFANGEMLRLAGGPARGWYPKQRQARPVSTENLDRLHAGPQGSLRAWEAAGTGSRKPLTLPPNLTPKFFNKSPREALRRVTSLLIRKGNSGTKEKDSRRDKDRGGDKEGHSSSSIYLQRSPGSDVTDSRGYHNFHHPHHQQHLPHHHQQQQHHQRQEHPSSQQHQQHTMPATTATSQKKKGFFKSFWKKSRHYSLEKQ